MLDVTRAYGLDFLFPAGDDTIGASLKRHGEFARPELDLLLAYAKPERASFIDVGANIGAIALPFAKLRPAWRVLAIEAHRGLAGVLAANAYGNHLYGVEPINAAAGPESRLVEFAAPPLSFKGNFGIFGVTTEANRKETVRMLRLDEIAPPDTEVVKIDVEGYELQVLEGAKDLLAARRAVWLAEAADGNAEAQAGLLETFAAAGYATYWFFAPFATPNSAKAAPDNSKIGDINLLALPPGAKNLWDLPAAKPGEPRPGSGGAYGYLTRYGYEYP